MLKEIKYLIFIVVIALFIFLTGRYYFSDENKKKSYRSYKNNDEKIKLYKKKNRERHNFQQNNRKWFCECCNHTYRSNGKNRHLKTKKHQSNSARYNLI